LNLFKERNSLTLNNNVNPQIKPTISTTDLMALERTKLANERTLLAYYRSSLATIAAATTLIQFFDNIIFVIIGYVLLPIGVAFLFLGLFNFKKSRKQMKEIIKK